MIIDTDKYIQLYSNCFDNVVLKETIKELRSLKTCDRKSELISNTHWETHSWYNPEKKEIKSRKNKELESTSKQVKHHDVIMKSLFNHILKYVHDLNYKCFTGWTGYTPILFHRYKKGTTMAAHIDHITSIFEDRKGVPILSVVGQLNDSFEGGEFVVLDKTIKMKAGDLLIFPSNFIFEHQVKTITKGTRLSFISWVY
tara:strand:- start:343 stop:939 length:597 start_codon:yes stop_codon:yes gene_type:complete